ncbi:MAG: lamin tail domain-containing protein [Bacteroidota bacterium]
MKHTLIFLMIALLCVQSPLCIGQITDNFSDKNFSENPKWTSSDSADWIINSAHQLQSNSRIVNNSFWISIPQALSDSVQWETDIRLTFNPSSANYADIYLISSTENPLDTANCGYFVRLGNTEDEIALYRKDRNNRITRIIDGSNGLLNKTENTFRIRVTRRGAKEWQIEYDPTQSGESYISGGSCIDTTYQQSQYFSIFIRQSTSGFFQKHFIDNIQIGYFNQDTVVEFNPYIPQPKDIIINEIMFDPIGSGSDYIELYNRSAFPINLKNFKLANKDNNNRLTNLRTLFTSDYICAPGTYLVFTEDSLNIRLLYRVANPEQLIEQSSLPSMPNDKGHVLLIGPNGQIIDELQYDADWHFALLNQREGIALERLHPDHPTNNADNWMSASKTSGYGSPTATNSQRYSSGVSDETITLSNKIFSPDHDSYEDVLMINYRFPEGGYVLNATVFDLVGRLVRTLQKQQLCGINGSFRWDGLDDQNRQLPMGHYIILTEVFNLKGNMKRYKNEVVLARRFQ